MSETELEWRPIPQFYPEDSKSYVTELEKLGGSIAEESDGRFYWSIRDEWNNKYEVGNTATLQEAKDAVALWWKNNKDSFDFDHWYDGLEDDGEVEQA